MRKVKGYLESGTPFFPYAHSGSISSLAFSPLLMVRRASSHCEVRQGQQGKKRKKKKMQSNGLTYPPDDFAHTNFKA